MRQQEHRGLGWRGAVAIAWAVMGAVAAAAQTVAVPAVTYVAGDVITPLPPGSPSPSSDPRDFEGYWASLGRPSGVDGGPPPYRPETKAEMTRLKQLEDAGTPTVHADALCRPNGPLAIEGNQFPTQILLRPDRMLLIAEEGRTIWSVDMADHHPAHPKPTYRGDSVAHWEGNTLVIDSISHRAKLPTTFSAGNSAQLHLVTRITRATAGSDPVNGARLVIQRTIDDPGVYTRPWTTVSVARWRPDLQMMDFNCEESSDDVISKGLTVEKK